MDEAEARLAFDALNGDFQSLKAYVKAKDHLQYTTLPEVLMFSYIYSLF